MASIYIAISKGKSSRSRLENRKKNNKGGGTCYQHLTKLRSRLRVRSHVNWCEKKVEIFFEGRLYKNINACLTNKVVTKAKCVKKKNRRKSPALSLAKKATKNPHNLKKILEF